MLYVLILVLARFGVYLTISILLASQPAHAWGEHGHDTITRVAVKNFARIVNNDPTAVRPFQAREHFLSHLSNVPDIVWRSPAMTEQQRASNYPTHYLNLESIYGEVESVADLEVEYAQHRDRADKQGVDNLFDLGSLPWRILQLQKLMTDSLISADKASSAADMIDAVNQALLYAGLMSHFVGDMANPHHTSANYDGQLTGNKGLHAYFESDIVMALPIDLVVKVDAKASTKLLDATVLRGLSEADRVAAVSDPARLVFLALVESHKKLDQLTALDDTYSRIAANSEPDKKALRREPSEVSQHYASFVIERLAVGASVLSQLWFIAWRQAGSPDLSNYKSYDYPVAPAYVEPDYLN